VCVLRVVAIDISTVLTCRYFLSTICFVTITAVNIEASLCDGLNGSSYRPIKTRLHRTRRVH